MNTSRLLAPFVLAALLIAGCATPAPSGPPLPPPRERAIISAPKDKVWPVLVAEIAGNYPVQVIEKDSGLITTQFVSLPAGYNNMSATRWIFKPGGFLATWAGLRMNMQVMVVELEPGRTQVTIRTHYEAFENNVQKAWIVAESNGSVENSILGKLERAFPAALP